VAVFDTTFHQTLPPEAYTYALPAELCQQHGIRRYGERCHTATAPAVQFASRAAAVLPLHEARPGSRRSPGAAEAISRRF
jgi:acetate kinase